MAAQPLPVPPIPPATVPPVTPPATTSASGSLNNPNLPITDPYAPTLFVLYNGNELPFCVSAEVTSNNWYQCDKFSAEFALWNDANFAANFWAQQDTMQLDIRFILNGAAPVSMIVGNVDHIDVDWIAGKVRIEGRDLTSNFIDHKVFSGDVNMTSSAIAAALAAEYGMDTDITPTTTPVGRYYQSDHNQMQSGEFSKSQTEWDLLTFLAQQEGDENGAFDVWVSGNTLHFKQATPIDQSKPWIITVATPVYGTGTTSLPFANAVSMKMTRALTLAKDVTVTVRSWNSQTKSGFNVTSGTSSGASKNSAQKFVFKRPNLSKDQAQKLADNLRTDITKHERKIEWTDAGGFPGALILTPRDAVQLQGTQSDWDQLYFIDTITRHLSMDGGLTISVSAKNHSTNSQATV